MISDYYSNHKKNILKNNEASRTLKSFSYVFVKKAVIQKSIISEYNKTFKKK